MNEHKLLIIFFGSFLSACYGARILGVFHVHSRSHYVIGAVILKALAAKGHHVTVLSPFPLAEPIPNFKDLSLNEESDTTQALSKDLIQDFAEKPILEAFALLLNVTAHQTELVFQNKEFQNLVASKEKFDLIIIDWFFNEAHLILGDLFDAPVILVSSFGTSANVNWIVGNTAPLAYVPSKGTSFTENMTFFQRIGNVFLDLIGRLLMAFTKDGQEKMLGKYFDKPRSVQELAERVALVFSNEHYSFDQVKPTVPNIIDVGGIHVEEPKKLPEDLQNFLDQAKEGVIYFSLGSNMKSVFLDPNKVKAIMRAFSKLQLQVLMKYEGEEIPDKPENVKFAKWLPQSDILAHPNMKVFITHGGLLSIIEAVYHSVPFIGIPIFGDQQTNVPRAVSSGYALQIDIDNVTEQSLTMTIQEMLTNSKYANTMKKRSKLLKQRPVKPLDEALFWVEHALEHKGADHLKNWSLKLAWYQYLLLDVLAFVAGILFAVAYSIYFVTKRVLLWRKREAALRSKKKN